MEHSENNLLSSCRSNKNTKKKNWDVCSSFLILAPFILCAPSSWCPNCANLFHPSRHCHSFLLAILLLDWKNNRRWSVFHPTNTISGLASSIKFPFSSSGRIKRKFKHIGVNLSLQICFLFFFAQRHREVFPGLQTGPYLSLRETSIFVTLATKVGSSRWVTEQHPDSLLFLPLKIHQTCKKWLQYSHPLFSDSLVSSGGCCVKERTSQRAGNVENFFFISSLSRRLPHKRFQYEWLKKWVNSSSLSCLFTHFTVNNQHLWEFTDAVCQSLGKTVPNYGSNPKPQWLPHHTFTSVKWQSCRNHQLITATVGN